MKTLKRSAVLLLAAAMLLGCFTITAYAGSESYTGVYNSKNYYTSLTASGRTYSAYLSYDDSGKQLRLDGKATIKDSDGYIHTDALYKTGYSRISDSGTADVNSTTTGARCSYFIGNVNIQNFSV